MNKEKNIVFHVTGQKIWGLWGLPGVYSCKKYAYEIAVINPVTQGALLWYGLSTCQSVRVDIVKVAKYTYTSVSRHFNYLHPVHEVKQAQWVAAINQ